jgi:hypothetical protein
MLLSRRVTVAAKRPDSHCHGHGPPPRPQRPAWARRWVTAIIIMMVKVWIREALASLRLALTPVPPCPGEAAETVTSRSSTSEPLT